MKSITVMGAFLLLGGCDVDRALPYYEGPPAAAPTPTVGAGTCPRVDTLPFSLPGGEEVCGVTGGCCEINSDCSPASTRWFCVSGQCCMPLSAWSRETHDGGGP